MKRARTTKNDSRWSKTQYANLIRYVPSEKYFARIRVHGKLILKSLKTDRVSVAKLPVGRLGKRGTAKSGEPDRNRQRKNDLQGGVGYFQKAPGRRFESEATLEGLPRRANCGAVKILARPRN